MPHAYTEDRLVEQPAIGLFAELGWTTVSALEETFGATGTLLRETKGEVVLVSRLCMGSWTYVSNLLHGKPQY
jgi:type I restriction enzyme R subunit